MKSKRRANYRAALDAATSISSHLKCHCRRASEPGRYMCAARLFLSIIGLLTVGPSLLSAADAVPWELVAKAPLIVKGRINVPLEQFNADSAKRRFDFLLIDVTVLQTYKGKSPASSIQVKYQAKGRSDAPSPQHVLSLNGKEVIMFLQYNDWPTWKGLYFTSHDPDAALSTYTQMAETTLVKEISWQTQAVAEYKPDVASVKYYREVEDLIHKMSDPKEAEGAYRDLAALGKMAAPAIVLQMENFQELPVQSLNTSLDPGIQVTYKPKVVVDALAVTLDQIAGTSFGRIGNGGSAREREAVIYGWKVWLTKQPK